MPVIKQNIRNSNVVVTDSGDEFKKSESSPVLSGFKNQKEKEYKVNLPTSVFNSNIINSFENTSSYALDKFIDTGAIRIDDSIGVSRLDEAVENAREIFNSTETSRNNNNINTGVVPIENLDFSPDDEVTRINESFSFTKLGELIERSRKSLDYTNIKVLSHEIFKINKNTQSGSLYDTNLLFLDIKSQTNSTLLNLKSSEIDKKETLSDRFFVYADDFEHNELIQDSYDESISLVNKIDQTSMIGNMLENEINYGNIVENFIKEGKSSYIGKISNQIILNSNNYSTLIGQDDKVLLDSQQKTTKSTLSKENLEIFYKNVSGFDYKEKNTRFNNSTSNFKIVNTDRIVGQLIVNYAVGHNSMYPNSDKVLDLEFYSSDIRKKINGDAFNKYPVIQFKDFNINSRLFSNKKLEFLAVNGNSLSIDKILRNIDESLKSENYIPETSIKSTLFFSWKDISETGKKYNEGEDINTKGTSYKNRKSLAGKKSSSPNLQTEIDNNIFAINAKDTSRLRGRSNTNTEFLFEKVYLDVDTKYTSSNDYLLPSFLKLPTRYFAKNAALENAPDAIDRRNEGTVLSNISIADLSSSDSFEREGLIKVKIEDSLFSNYSPSNAFNDVSDSDNPDNRDIAGFKEAKDEFLDVVKTKYSKFINGSLNSNSNVITIEGSSSTLTFESYLDDYIIRKNDNIGIQNNEFDIGQDLNLQELQFSENDDNVSSMFNESLKNHVNIFANKAKEIKNDCFVFGTSNSFLSSSEVNEVVLSNYSHEKINELGLNLTKTKAIKSSRKRFLNANNTTDNVLGVFKGSNNVAILSLKISNAINMIKKKLSNNVTFESIFNKAKSKVVQQENFTLLYDTFEENCLDTFEKSPFITSEGFYKNNFVKEFSLENKNTTKLIIDDNSDIEDNDLFTSKGFRQYLSKIYTKSFVRSKTTLLKRVLKDNVDLFELESNYPVGFTNMSNYFGFDVLLAKSLSGVNSNNANEIKDVCKVILANSIIRSSGIDSQISAAYSIPNVSFSRKNKTFNKDLSDNLRKIFGEEIINNFVNVVFNKNNIHSMDNKIIRSTHTNSMKDIKSFNLTSVDAINGLSIDYVEGNMCQLVFPGFYVVERFGRDSGNPRPFKSISDKAIRKASTINTELVSNATSIEDQNILNEKRVLKESLYQASSNMLYNYDIFINEEETGVVFYEKDEEDSSFSSKGFNFVKNEVNKGIDLKIDYKLFKRVTTSDIGLDENQIGEVKLPYRDVYVYIPLSYFHLSTKRNTFSKKITDLCTDMLSVFDIKYDNINSVEEVLQFIDNNSYLVRIAQDILEVFSMTFLQSFENYNAYIEEKIRLESINKDMSKNEFKSIVRNYNILNSDLDTRRFCVSDIKAIFDKITNQSEVTGYQTSDYIVRNFPAAYIRETIYTKRFFELQIVNKMLQNSDLSEALCLDIIHGYFLNLEENKNLEMSSRKSLEDNIEEINRKVNSIQESRTINIKEHVFDEFYQNKLSKDIQEIMFYKNIFNETFIKNNLYNSNKQKYENENMFNHRKLYYFNSYNRGIQSLNLIGNNLSGETNNNLDILRIPIDFNVANRIGTRGFLKINIQPVNLKFPEIEYETITKYYTPMLTGLTSNFMSSLSNSFFDFCGIYNDTQRISERYNVVSKDVAISEVKKLIRDIFSLKSEEDQIPIVENVDAIANNVYNDNIISSAVSHLDFVIQSPINENIKIKNVVVDNLVSKETVKLLRSISIENLRKVIKDFDETILNESFIENDKEYAQTLNNSEVLKNNSFYHKFIKELDRDISQQDLVLAMIPNNLHDVFNIVIDRDLIDIQTSSSPNELIDMDLGSFNGGRQTINKSICLSYYISFEVIWHEFRKHKWCYYINSR